MQSVIIYLVCYFYALKVSKKLLDSDKTRRIFNIGLLILGVTLAITMLYQFIGVHSDVYLCHTFSFVLP